MALDISGYSTTFKVFTDFAADNIAEKGGATISLDPDTGRIVLCRALPLATLDGDKFYTEVERFVNTAETWAKVVSNYRDATTEAPGESDVDAAPAFSASGFMQV